MSGHEASGGVGGAGAPYVELHIHTNYSLLEGASHPEELIATAAGMGYQALAVTDRDNLFGAMEIARACRARGIRPITGLELTLSEDGEVRRPLTLLAASRTGYSNLCRLVSLASGHALASQAARGRRRRSPFLPPELLGEHADGLICLTGGRSAEVPSLAAAGDTAGARRALRRWVDLFGRDRVWVELQDNLVHGDRPRNAALVALARSLGLGVAATGDVHYHDPSRHRLHDALTAIRQRSTLEETHRARRPNGELYLRSPAEQARHFAEWPEALEGTLQIAEACAFQLTSDLGYSLPSPPVPPGHSPDSWLAELCSAQLERRYPASGGSRPAATARLSEELGLISRHGLAGFFLVYHQVLQLATEVAGEVRSGAPRSRSGLPPGRGRGSSVGSLVCYLIGLSHIDPVQNNLFLGRFLNEDMASLPDIDLDFPRDIRDKLFQRVYATWGADHAALVASFVRYRVRSAVRDLGKALGLPSSELDRLAKLSDQHASARSLGEAMDAEAWLRDRRHAEGWSALAELAYELADFPRHISQHPGGMVISSDPLTDYVPIQPAAWPGRYICQWDKDSVEDARMVKIDFLSLGMLSLVEECIDRIAETRGETIDLSQIDYDDPAVYARIAKGDTVGVFQIESRAQAGMLPRTRPANLDDLAAQVAIIRPGPISGGAVHPYVQRRRYPERRWEMQHPCVAPALGETLGVVLYQEQVVQVCMLMGGFSAGEAEAFRRAMGRRDGAATVAAYRERFIAGAERQGVPLQVAEEMLGAICGFAQYGFPKSHATAFALLSYQSAWLKEHYPAEFYCALYDNWPMGFYPPHVVTNDARRHGVQVLRPDVNKSAVHCALEGGNVRLGLRFVAGIGAPTAAALVAERDAHGPFRSMWDLVQRAGALPHAVGTGWVENAVRAGAVDGFGLERRELLWQLGLFAGGPRATSKERQGRGRERRQAQGQLRLDLFSSMGIPGLPATTPYEAMSADYELLELSPDWHPMRFLRGELGSGVLSSSQLLGARPGRRISTAGLVVCRQRPENASGAVFLLLEDEDGLVNVHVAPGLYQARRSAIRASPFLLVRGRLEGDAGQAAMVHALQVAPLQPPGTMRAPGSHDWG